MNYDKPKLRDFKHGAPYISIWYSIVFHAVLFIVALNLAKLDFALMADDIKRNVKTAIASLFKEELSPSKSIINELYQSENRVKFNDKNLAQIKSDS